ncbi:MAG: hypothetical protein ACTSW3_04575 [Promethearchaeota archaeon]
MVLHEIINLIKIKKVLILGILIQLIFGLIISISSLENILKYIMPDDAFYYFEIAKNVAHGYGVTFDTVNKTNGFHPVWLILLVPVFYLNLDKILILRIIILYQLLFAIGEIFFLYKITFKLIKNEILAFFSCILWTFNVYNVSIYLGGTEASLNGFILSVIFYYFLKWDFKEKKELHFFAFLLSLSFVIRLDNLIIIIFFLSWLIFSKKLEIKLNNLKLLLSFFVIIIILPMCYLSWNYLNFNHFFPISGILWGIDIFNIITYAIFIFIISLFLSLYYRSRPLINVFLVKVESKFIFIIVISCLHFPYYLYIRGRIANWYLPLEIMFFSIFIPFLLLNIIELRHSKKVKKEMIKPSIFIKYSAITFILYISICFISNYLIINDLFFRHQEDLDIYIVSNWLNTNTPQDAIIASGNAGKLGYFTDRILIEIWGLVNSFEFVEKYKGNVSKFIIEGNYDYYVDRVMYFWLSYEELKALGLILVYEYGKPANSSNCIQVWQKI